MEEKIIPWHEQDALWEALEPVFFTQRRKSSAPLEIEKIISFLRIGSEKSVLDLCCGIGRHSLEFARRGYQVTGVDRTKAYLDKASKQATSEDLKVEFVLEDMRRFVRPESFDVCINVLTSFGYFENPEDDLTAVSNIFQSLTPGGVLLMDLMGKEILARNFRERDWQEEDDIFILEERKISQAWSWTDNRWIIIKDNQRFEARLSFRIYSAVELCALMTEGGFSSVEVFGDLNGSPYDHAAKRLIVVAHKR